MTDLVNKHETVVQLTCILVCLSIHIILVYKRKEEKNRKEEKKKEKMRNTEGASTYRQDANMLMI